MEENSPGVPTLTVGLVSYGNAECQIYLGSNHWAVVELLCFWPGHQDIKNVSGRL